MWYKKHWTKYTNGHYGYIDGVNVKNEDKAWVVYTVCSGERNVLYSSDTLSACKYWLAHSYNKEEEHNGHFHFK